MDKWTYIREIIKRGDRYGKNGGVLSMLEHYGKINTQEITEAEAREFYERGNKNA